MHLGVGSYTWPWAVGIPDHPPENPLSAFDVLDRAKSLGVMVVQICDNLPLDCLSSADLDRLAADAQDAGIELEAGTRGCMPGHLLAQLRIAGRVGSRILRVVLDSAGDEPPLDEIIRRLREVRPAFEDADIILAIENHDRFRAAEFAEIVKAAGQVWVGICLDTVNSFGALEGPEVVVQTLAPLTVNLHVKDFTIGRHASQLGFSIVGAPAGQGRLDVPWVLRELKKAGRDVNSIVELWPPLLGSLDETIRQEANWAEQSVRYLRTLIAD